MKVTLGCGDEHGRFSESLNPRSREALHCVTDQLNGSLGEEHLGDILSILREVSEQMIYDEPGRDKDRH